MNAYILVGGRSTRMGSSKTALFLGDLVAVARPLFAEVIAVDRHPGEPLPIRTIHEEPHDDEAPIFGLERALLDADGPCLVLAVDYPLVTAPVLSYLIARTITARADALVPVWHGQPQPLCAGYRAGMLPLIRRSIGERQYSLRNLLVRAEAEMIAEADLRARFPGEPLMNVNTPEEWQAAKELYD